MVTKNAISNIVAHYRTVLRKCTKLNIVGAVILGTIFAVGGGGGVSAEQVTQDLISESNGVLDDSTFSDDGTLNTTVTAGRLSLQKNLQLESGSELYLINADGFPDSLFSSNLAISGARFILGNAETSDVTRFANGGTIEIRDGGKVEFLYGAFINTLDEISQGGLITIQSDGELITNVKNLDGILKGRLFIDNEGKARVIGDVLLTPDLIVSCATSNDAQKGQITFNRSQSGAFVVDGILALKPGYNPFDIGNGNSIIATQSLIAAEDVKIASGSIKTYGNVTGGGVIRIDRFLDSDARFVLTAPEGSVSPGGTLNVNVDVINGTLAVQSNGWKLGGNKLISISPDGTLSIDGCVFDATNGTLANSGNIVIENGGTLKYLFSDLSQLISDENAHMEIKNGRVETDKSLTIDTSYLESDLYGKRIIDINANGTLHTYGDLVLIATRYLDDKPNIYINGSISTNGSIVFDDLLDISNGTLILDSIAKEKTTISGEDQLILFDQYTRLDPPSGVKGNPG
jgi:hypothetical protein